MKSLCYIIILMILPLGARGQHDAQRNAVRALAKGDAKGFEKAFRKPKVDAGREETQMVNILKLLSEDKVDEALELAEKSLEAGFNASRLYAGSRGTPITPGGLGNPNAFTEPSPRADRCPTGD